MRDLIDPTRIVLDDASCTPLMQSQIGGKKKCTLVFTLSGPKLGALIFYNPADFLDQTPNRVDKFIQKAFLVYQSQCH
jgi:hypothetical protein